MIPLAEAIESLTESLLHPRHAAVLAPIEAKLKKLLVGRFKRQRRALLKESRTWLKWLSDKYSEADKDLTVAIKHADFAGIRPVQENSPACNIQSFYDELHVILLHGIRGSRTERIPGTCTLTAPALKKMPTLSGRDSFREYETVPVKRHDQPGLFLQKLLKKREIQMLVQCLRTTMNATAPRPIRAISAP